MRKPVRRTADVKGVVTVNFAEKVLHGYFAEQELYVSTDILAHSTTNPGRVTSEMFCAYRSSICARGIRSSI